MKKQIERLKSALQRRGGKNLKVRLVAAALECQELESLSVLELRRLIDEAMCGRSNEEHDRLNALRAC